MIVILYQAIKGGMNEFEFHKQVFSNKLLEPPFKGAFCSLSPEDNFWASEEWEGSSDLPQERRPTGSFECENCEFRCDVCPSKPEECLYVGLGLGYDDNIAYQENGITDTLYIYGYIILL